MNITNSLSSVRNRLVIILILAVLIPVVVTQYIQIRVVRAGLSTDLDEDLHIIAESEGDKISQILRNQVELLSLLSQRNVIQTTVVNRSNLYTGTAEEIEALQLEQDEAWLSASDDDSLVQSVVSHPLSFELAEFLVQFPNHKELIIADAFGGTVASTARTSDFYQADEEWWQVAYNNGIGQVYISQESAVDESTGFLAINIAIPIFRNDGSTVEGILRATYNAQGIGNFLANARFGDTGRIVLVRENGQVIPLGVPETITQIPTALLAGEHGEEAHVEGFEGLETMTAPDGKRLISIAGHIETDGAIPAIDELGWSTVLLQSESEAFSIINREIRISIISAVLVTIIASIFAIWLARIFTNPLDILSTTAREIGLNRNWSKRVNINSKDEFGQLANSFNLMAAEVESAIQAVETRSEYLETTVEVGSLVTRLNTQEELLASVTEFIRARFDLYYTQIYMLDDTKRYALLKSGTGNVGKQLIARKHNLDTEGRSLVATAVQTQKSVLVSNTEQSDIHQPNPLLPNTRSEVAIPLMVGSEVLGVLDMQAQRVGTFNEDNLGVFEAMASQVASALYGTRATSAVQRAIIRAEQLNARNVSENWRGYLGSLNESGKIQYQFDVFGSNDVQLLDDEHSLHDIAQNIQDQYSLNQTVKLGGQNVGRIIIRENSERQWTDEEHALIEAAADRLAQAAEQFRAFDETETARKLSTTLYTMGQKLSESNSLQEILDTVAEESLLSNGLSYSLLSIELDSNNQPEWTEAVAVRGSTPVQVGDRYYLPEFPFSNFWLSNPREATIVSDIAQDERVDANTRQLLEQFQTPAIVLLPLLSGGQWQGLLTISWATPQHFTTLQRELYQSIITPLSTEMSNVLLLEQTQRRALEMETVAQVSAAATSTLDMDVLLQSVTDLTKSQFNLYHTHIYLLDEKTNDLILTSGAGEVGQKMVEAGHAIPLSREASVVASAAREREGLIIDDVTLAPNFLANENLPDTRSEIAVPMIVGNKVVGVMDAQSRYVARFSKEDVQVFTALASQIAVAVENVRVFDEVRESRAQLQEVLTEVQGLNQALDTFALVAVTNVKGEILSVNERFIEVSKYSREELIGQDHRILNSGHHPKEFMRDLWVTIANGKIFNGVIKNRAKDGSYYWVDTTIVPLLNDQGKPYRYVAIRREVTQQIAAQEQIRKRAVEMETVSQVSAAATSTLDLDLMLQSVNDLTKSQFGLYHTHIYLLNEKSGELVLTSGAGAVGQKMVAVGHTIPLSREASVVASAAREREGLIIDDVTLAPNFLANENLPLTRSEMAVPMVVGNKVVGVMDAQSTEVGQFTNEDIRVFTALAAQVAVAVENIRVFDEVQESRGQLQEVLTEVQGLNQALDTFALVAVTNVKGEILSVNERFVEVSKYAREELIGQDHRILNSGHHPKEFMRDLWVTIANGKIFNGVIKNRAKDGSYYWVDTTIVPLLNEQGKPFRYVAIRREVTQQIAAQEQIRKRAVEMETVSQVSAAATSTLDMDVLLQSVVDLTKRQFDLYHTHIYLMDEAQENLRLTAGAGEVGQQMVVRGHNIRLGNEASLVARAARNGEGVIVDDVTQATDFLPNPALPLTRSEMAVPMIVQGEVIGVMDAQSIVVGRFTNDDVQVFTALAAQVAVAIENARAFEREHETVERLREVDQLKSQFLANMSHELRTPLNSIIGYAGILVEGAEGELPEEALMDIEIIHQSGQHLLSIINDILDLAKIEAREMKLRMNPMPLPKILEEVTRSGQVLANEKSIKLELIAEDEIPDVKGDMVRLRQITWNLVSNAMKFTEKGGVTVRYGMLNENEIFVRIEDTGIGIPSDQVQQVFERFRQVDESSTRSAGGTGLGLTITRELIHLHGGEIYAESELGVGSTFWFKLPVYVPETEPETKSELTA